jgi:ribosomal protein S18 acetylase RimI-like enzyme
MSLSLKYNDRTYTDDDLQAVCDLLNLCDSYDKTDDSYSLEDLKLEFDHPRLDKQKDLRIWFDEAGNLVAFGQIWTEFPEDENQVEGFTYFRIHPEVRQTAIPDEVMNWLERRLVELGAEHNRMPQLRGGSRDFDTFSRNMFEKHGYTIVRYFFKMERDLSQPIAEPVFPEGFTLASNSGDDYVEKWVECYNQSFIDHWGFHPKKVEDHKHWLKDDKYRPELDLIGVAPDGTFAGFSFLTIDPDDNERNNRKWGWVNLLGTRRGFRKIGLGKALLLNGLKVIKANGMDTAVLGVDAANPSGALGLYESVGFRTTMTSVAYKKDL